MFNGTFLISLRADRAASEKTSADLLAIVDLSDKLSDLACDSMIPLKDIPGGEMR